MALDIAVAASADDASESAGTVSITANPLANCTTTGVWNGWRFNGITIPAGAIITSAYLTVRFSSSTLDEPDVTLYAQNSATPATFTTAASSISGRARTTASVAWANTNAGTADVQTSSLVTIVQELVNAYAPYSSGSMVFLMTTRAAVAARDTSVTSYDGSTTLCARLHLDWNLQLLPAKHTNASTLYAATLTLLVTLTPAPATNTPTVYAPTFAMGTLSLSAAKLTNASTLPAPSLIMGALTFTPALLNNTPAVSVLDGAGNAIVDGAGNRLTAHAESYNALIYAPTFTVEGIFLTPSLLTNTPILYAPTLVMGSITLTPLRITDPDTVYAPTLVMGALTLLPARIANTSTLHDPTLQVAGGALTPARLLNANTVYAPTIVMGAIALHANLLANGSIVYLAILAVSAAPIVPVAERTASVDGDPRSDRITTAPRGASVPARNTAPVPRDPRTTTIRRRT